MSIDQGFVAAYESHHVAYLKSFGEYEKASIFLHEWSTDIHSWPVCIYNARENHLWLWCGYRTMEISRESALEDARAFLRLPIDHQFEKIESMTENL